MHGERTFAALLLALLALTPAPAAPAEPRWQVDWARGAVFYEVFVPSFADSDGDGRGDLPGLIGKLDYLQQLGIEGLWISPVTRSPSYHKYDVVDEEHVDPGLGTDADFDRLCREAHRRGIRIMVELVAGTTSDQHPWFVDSASSTTSAHRDWYLWRDADPGWHNPWWGDQQPAWRRGATGFYYAVPERFMPSLNLRNPAVQAELARIARRWIDRGADAFRLDAPTISAPDDDAHQEHTPDLHRFWKGFARSIRASHPRALLVAEVWRATPVVASYYGDSARLGFPDEIPMTWNFPLSHALVEAVASGDAAGVGQALRAAAEAYPRGALDAPFLTHHHMTRIATVAGGHPGKLRTAAALLLTLPGTPFVFYGEELGMVSRVPPPGAVWGQPEGERQRTPMPWDGSPRAGFTTGTPWLDLAPGHAQANVAAEAQDPGSLLSRYRALIALRRRTPALRRGELTLLPAAGGGVAFLRREGAAAVLVAHNLGAAPATLGPWRLPGPPGPALLADEGVGAPRRVDGGWSVVLPPYASAIFPLRPRSALPSTPQPPPPR